MEIEELRQKYFLDPLGSNREIIPFIMERVMFTILDWYTLKPNNRTRLSATFDDNYKLEDVKGDKKHTWKNHKEFIDNYYEKSQAVHQERLKLKDSKYGAPAAKDLEKKKDEVEKLYLDFKYFGDKIKCLFNTLGEIDAKDPSIHFNHNFFGQQHPHDNIIALIVSFIATFINENAITAEVSPGINLYERFVIAWLRRIIGYKDIIGGECRDPFPEKVDRKYWPEDIQKTYEKEKDKELWDVGGNVTSGGTVANLTALLIARNKLMRKIIDERSDKLTSIVELCNPRDIYNLVILAAKNWTHYSISKITHILGLRYREVESNSDGKINVEELKKEIKKCKEKNELIVAIVASAGSTEIGAIDPLEEIAKIVEDYNNNEEYPIWLHVDAAHGGAYLLSNKKELKQLFKGIEKADSVTIDGHKMFYTYYPCGGVVFKDRWDTIRYFSTGMDIHYLDPTHFKDFPGYQTVEGSRGIQGIMQWYYSIKTFGKEGYRILLNHTLNLTDYLKEELDKRSNFQRLSDGPLNMVLFRYNPQDYACGLKKINDLNEKIRKELLNNSNFYIGSDKISKELLVYNNGKTYSKIKPEGNEKIFVLRAVLVHPYIEPNVLDKFLEEIENLGNMIVNKK